nr:hypothetical protein [Tanacetum cinerariifolium]
ASLEVEDSHVTLTPVNPDGQQEISSVSSQFVTSMLNSILDVGMESIFETTSRMDVQTPTSVAPLPITTPTMTSSTIATTTTTSHAPILPTTRINEAVKAAVQIQSDQLRVEAQRENDEFLRSVDENIKKIIKESSHLLRTSYTVVADLSEMKLKKILIEKIEASTPMKTATRSTGMSSQGSRSRQASASESALAKEPMQTTSQMEKPSHPKFDAGADDQLIVQSSQHPEWFPPQQKPPTLDRDWNKTMSAVHKSIQQVDTFTPELLARPTYDLMKGSYKRPIKLKYHLEDVYKATTDQLDWINPEGQQYPHNLQQHLPLIPNNRGRRVIPFEHFINNDLEYLRG